ncbi:hypothetical protein FVR03_20180 [Pontibacter qinzhouensis]|uniref:Uncharacterized protein n=1 Tax=Pontibacter qinzhouensis TaxID=2603253 RepID=A0A5C8J282_9BACT|nr:hypothetical protein [Pontibacter qinzhouensis]TXK30861.1 hypothetical protein FVR03_20180 [Pontibacter qinzhouensis]
MMEIKTVLSEKLKKGRNAVYYASGTIVKERYQSLPYDTIVLVDVAFRQPITVVGKVICLALWSTYATALFKELGIQLDAYITGNDGLAEGGGLFPLNSNHSLSNILPVLKETYIHIAFPDQYRRKWKKLFEDMPLTSIILSPSDSDFINPAIFSSMKKPGSCWRVTKKAEAPASFRLGNRTIIIQRQNIWEDQDKGTLFVRCPPNEAHNLKAVAPNVEILKDYTFEQILRFCNRNETKVLRLSPWLRGNYSYFLQYLKANEIIQPYPKTIHFYHLHKNDFQQLYSIAEQHAMCGETVYHGHR